MKNLQITSTLFTLLLTASFAAAQSGDWQVVKALTHGTPIKVKLKHGHGSDHCMFQEATDDEFACELDAGGSSVYRRDEVRAIYLNPGHHNAKGPGLVVGSALFVPTLLIAVVAGPVPILVAAGGICVWYFVTKAFVHGKTIYRSMDAKGTKGAAKP